MPSISERGEKMPQSAIRKLVPFANKAKQEGKTIYHLNIGQPDILSPEKVMEGIREIDVKYLEYSPSAGLEGYREGIAKYYQNLGHNIGANNVIVTTGGSEALTFAFMSCLNPSDEILTTEPFYANYNGFASIANVKIKPIKADIKDGFSLPPISKFKEQITSKTKAILVCNPGNPTGYLYTKEELEEIKELVIEHDLYLFSDEVYREFCYDGKQHVSAFDLKGIEDNVVIIDSTSKRYSMCGARIGAFISLNEKLMSTCMKYAQARLSPPLLGQLAGLKALDTEPSYFDAVRDEYVERRNLLVNGLNKIHGVICPKPSGAFYTVAQLPIDDSDKFCQWLLEEFSYENQTVMLAPASGFYASKEDGINQVRIAYVLNLEALSKAVKCLEEALKVYPGRV
ncbi:MAG: pyridoxal phosphate-dependent aminotransferase [Flavobacteriales bacterium]|nr:pyridoxal phosphate-dependent aminotransferase [Flavobacteriales bacterium]